MKQLSRSWLLAALCLVTVWGILPAGKGFASEVGTPSKIVITVKASPSSQHASQLEVKERRFLKSFAGSRVEPTTTVPELPYAYLTLVKGRRQVQCVVDYSFAVYPENGNSKFVLSPEAKTMLNQYIQTLREQHFGQPIPWTQAKELLPRKGNAQVVDLETGKSFMVQRRAGSRHADVQPLTEQDSHVMKEIYNGKWSWRRRAILVKTDDKTIAASMNGMPHGAGAIYGNDFPGHFCIHFEASTTHGKRTPDPAHYLMVRKASGLLTGDIVQYSPQQLIQFFSTALHEQDWETARMALDLSNSEAVQLFLEQAKGIEAISLWMHAGKKGEVPKVNGPLWVELPVKVSMVTDKGKVRKDATILIRRNSLISRWKIDAVSLLELFGEDKQTKQKQALPTRETPPSKWV